LSIYKPHPGQKLLHQAQEPLVVVMSGNRYGKTHALVAEMLAGVLGYRPWEVPNLKMVQGKEGPEYPHRNTVPKSTWVRRVDGLPIRHPANLLVLSGLQLERGIGEIIQAKVNELWPRSVPFKVYLGSGGYWKKASFQNGSTVYFGSAHQPDLSFEGSNYDQAYFDEPIPKRIVTAVQRGLVDHCGRIVWTMTPLGGPEIAWVASDILERPADEVRVIRGSSDENPFLNKEALARFLDNPLMDDAERRARRHGELGALGYRVVPTFKAHNIVEPFDIPATAPRVCVIDPHHSKPSCAIWAATTGDGSDRTFVIYREYPTFDIYKAGIPAASLDELAGDIKTLEGRENIVWRLCDPQFGQQHAKVHGEQFPSFVERMAEHKLYWEPAVDNDLERGIPVLRSACVPNNVTKKPRVLVFNTCKNVIRALNLWSYQVNESTGLAKPSELFKDFADCVRYALMGTYCYTGEAFSYLESDDAKNS
jgi:hypothetical protein